ncbi:MAG: RNA degradosome polyphosphate kinase, partial [Lachnospiraceae bacterium]|nr:RNA degradosome polyphosphate kinase [Lachnospiraceae bacterium]
KQGKEARIVAKMNALCDPVIIKSLYEASCAGVKIDLIIRGICCLKAGVKGLSENITVRSIVGNFLEHARIFYFYNDGFEDVYMGSADWMPRNLDKRVEITFPVEDEDLKKSVIEILNIQLADTLKAHFMQPDGTYEKLDLRGRERIEAQLMFCKQAISRSKSDKKEKESRVFIPKTKVE